MCQCATYYISTLAHHIYIRLIKKADHLQYHLMQGLQESQKLQQEQQVQELITILKQMLLQQVLVKYDEKLEK